MINKRFFERTKDDLGDLPNTIPTAENGEPLVPLSETGKLCVRPIWKYGPFDDEAAMYQSYIKTNPRYNQIYVRKTVAKKLLYAAALLPKEWRLVVAAGHRPLQVQQNLYNQYRKVVANKNSSLTEDQIDALTRELVADPSRKPPGHCCGSAVDVNALNSKTGELVDFGSPINSDSPKSSLHNADVSKQAVMNRLILLEAMLKAGFSSLKSEWWHYSYGDQNWAAFYEKPQAIYGLKEV